MSYEWYEMTGTTCGKGTPARVGGMCHQSLRRTRFGLATGQQKVARVPRSKWARVGYTMSHHWDEDKVRLGLAEADNREVKCPEIQNLPRTHPQGG